MGSSTRDSFQYLPRRLVNYNRYEKPSSTPYEPSSAEASGFELACEYKEISTISYHQAGTLRISTRYDNNDCPSS
ncbi:hypothetical protein AB4K20DRAFT_1916083 [Rhizopus microsporus]